MTLTEQVTESSEDSLPCSMGQGESQEVNITSNRNPPHEEAFPEKHGIVPYDEVMISHKAPPEKSDSVGLLVKLPSPPPTANELLCFVQSKVEVLPKDNLAQR